MKWKHPSIIKIYEALGAVADGRVEGGGDTGKVYSSTGNKFYDVSYDPIERAIMANDNSSYWQGNLGYPAIAYLMKIKVLPYDENVGALLKGIPWKDLNQKFKNNFDKTLDYILSTKSEVEQKALQNFVEKVAEEIKILDLSLLGKRVSPPTGY